MTRPFSAITILTVGFAAFSTSTPAQAFDMDCKVILCLAGGFPSGCGDARSYMMDRLRDRKPPFGACSSEGPAEGEDYTVPVRMFTRTYPRRCVRWVYVREGHGDSSNQCAEFEGGYQNGVIEISIPSDDGQADFSNEFVWWTRPYQERSDN